MRAAVAVGVDGSPESLAAADWAAREAALRRVPLRLVHAAAPLPGIAAPADPLPPPEDAGWNPDGLAGELRRAHPDLPVEVEQAAGQPLPVLFAAAEQADVLVLGSRGVGAAAGFLLGSVPLTVAGQASVPVVLVRGGAAEAEGASTGAGGGDVVVGLDLGGPVDRLLRFAFDAAARRGTSLRVVHGRGAEPQDADRADGADDAALTDALARCREEYPQIQVTTEPVESDDEGGAVSHLVAASSDAALLVIGRRPRGTRLSPHLGTTAHAVLHRATVPVAVVPHD